MSTSIRIGSIIGCLFVLENIYFIRDSLSFPLIVAHSLIPDSSHLSSSFFATSLISSIKVSFYLTYTNPRVTISGPDTTFAVLLSKEITTIIIPFSDSSCLSLSTIFPTSPTPSPSTSTIPDVT